MGYYTEFKFKATLKKDTPEDIIELLDIIINGDIHKHLTGKEAPVMSCVEDTIGLPIEDAFGSDKRWDALFFSNNWDAENIKGSTFNKVTKRLTVHSEFKNYTGTIGKFIGWLSPYIIGRQGKFLGSYKGEDQQQQTNIYLGDKLYQGEYDFTNLF